MKTKKYILSLAVAAAMFAGCSNDETLSRAGSAGSTEGALRLNITTTQVGSTRAATDITGDAATTDKTDSEKKVQTLFCGIFDNDNLVEKCSLTGINQSAVSYSTTVGHEYTEGGSGTAGKSIAAGQTAVVALNLPTAKLAAYEAFTSKATLLASQLSIQEALTPNVSGTLQADWLPMFGTGTIADNDGFEASVTVKHLVAKVTLASLSVDFTGTGHTAASFTPEQVFLINVPGKLDMQFAADGTYQYAAEDLSALYQGEADSWTGNAAADKRQYLDFLGSPAMTAQELKSGSETYLTRYSLYTMPNKQTTTDNTRLVIKGSYKADATATATTCYYAVNLGTTTSHAVAPNSHHIVTVVIKGQGAEDAYSDIPSTQDMEAQVSVVDWNEQPTTATFGDDGLTVTPNVLNVELTHASMTYTGAPLDPGVTVKDTKTGTTLTLTSDYTVDYSDNENAGTCTVTITGAGTYAGKTVKTTFEIAKAAGTITFATTALSKNKNSAAFTNAATLPATGTGQGTITYSVTSDADGVVSSIDATTGEVTLQGTNVGEATITATVSDATNYEYATPTASYTLTVKAGPDTNGLAVGQIFYSDGSHSTTLETDGGKTPVGIIVYVNDGSAIGDAATEKGVVSGVEGGHALVMCLKFASTGAQWRNENTAYGEDFYTSIQSEANSFYKGYARSKAMSDQGAADYPAANSAQTYNTIVAPDGTTGWFLPSAGQFYLAHQKIAERNLSFSWSGNGSHVATDAGRYNAYLSLVGSGNYDEEPTTTHYVWTSSEYDSSLAIGVYWNTLSGYGLLLGSDVRAYSYYVRPFLAF